MMSAQDKKMKEVVRKKIAPINPIKAKCCVCNNFFSSQSELDQHLLLHQSKLDRTTLDELQRKTQESFRTKKQPSAFLRTTSGKREPTAQKQQDLPERDRQKRALEEDQQVCGESQEQEISQALRESQILLEKIQFLTQIAEPAQQQYIQSSNAEQEEEEKTIPNEHALYLQLYSPGHALPEWLILRTDFEEEYLGNYQEQLRQLQKMMKGVTDPDCSAKLTKISKAITSNVISELRARFGTAVPKRAAVQEQKEVITSAENAGQVAYCSLCFTEISCGSSYLQSQLGTAYHKECFEEE